MPAFKRCNGGSRKTINLEAVPQLISSKHLANPANRRYATWKFKTKY